jgi:hypothetical protein
VGTSALADGGLGPFLSRLAKGELCEAGSFGAGLAGWVGVGHASLRGHGQGNDLVTGK